MKKNENFEEIYETLTKQDFSVLEKSWQAARHDGAYSKIISWLAYFSLAVFSLSFMACFGMPKVTSGINVPVLICAISGIVILLRVLDIKVKERKEKQYRKMYLSEFNPAFLKLIEPDFSYDSNKGISEKSYRMIQFVDYGKYEANGLISGKLSNGCSFRAGQITTRSTYEKQDGSEKKEREERIDYDGILYEIKLPFSIDSKLYLRSDKRLDHAGFLKKLATPNPDMRLSKIKVQLDSEEFERLFDVYAENKMLAMQIFTADIMKDLEKLYTKTSNKFELTIDNDMLYIGFATGAIFRAPEDLSVPVLDKETLDQYYNNFIDTLEFNENFIKILEESNVR